jgi:hypothetical protein
MSDGDKLQFLEIDVGALVHGLKLPVVGTAVAQGRFRQARIEAAKTRRLLEDLEDFFKGLREDDGYPL